MRARTGELEYPFGRGINFQIEVSAVSVLVERLCEANITLSRTLKESLYRGEDTEFGQIEFIV
jgi:hypothetical protein